MESFCAGDYRRDCDIEAEVLERNVVDIWVEDRKVDETIVDGGDGDNFSF